MRRPRRQEGDPAHEVDVVCVRCGRLGRRTAMTFSPQTGNWCCRDIEGCERRTRARDRRPDMEGMADLFGDIP
jgi:hypothetical protein